VPQTFWQQHATITTFIVTFFLSKAYEYWRAQLKLARGVQGGLQELNMLLTAHCLRTSTGDFTAESRQLLEETARNARLAHTLLWASIDDSLAPLHTPRGLRRLLERGLMTEREYSALLGSGAPPTRRHDVVLSWLLARAVDARARNTVEFGAGTESVLVSGVCELRRSMASVAEELVSRMPMAYVHLVHLLVDTFLVSTPFVLYPRCGVLVVPAAGLLTLFFRGLLELSKSFLDPFGNEGSDGQEEFIRTDTLLAECNSASTRWWRGAERLPFDTLPFDAERCRQ